MFMFQYTIPGHSAAWFVTDGLVYYRWIQAGDKTHYAAAGIGSTTFAPSYIGELSLLGSTPP